METKHYIAVVVLFSALLTFFAGQVSGADYTAGRKIFKSKCEVCHVMAGSANYSSTFHRDFRPKDFSASAAWSNLNEEKIRFVLSKGQGVMRPVPLSPEETKALIDYMTHELKK